MSYALKLSEEGRVLSACVVLRGGVYDGMPVVSALPDGNIADYRYVGGEFLPDPLPIDGEQTAQGPSLEGRVELLEATTDDIILMMAELIGGE